MKPEKKKICKVSDKNCEYIECGIWCSNYKQKLKDEGENIMYDKFINQIHELWERGLFSDKTYLKLMSKETL